jgi:uncharacterized protein YjbI with pentapeptide repeats
MIDVESLTEAEQRLIDAVENGYQCDFFAGQIIQQSEMADWGPERTIRAAVLKSLLTDAAHGGIETSARNVDLRGAVVSDDLHGFDGVRVSLQMSCCRIDGEADFRGATFTDVADLRATIFAAASSFYGATFTENAYFNGAIFTTGTSFGGAVFTIGASFDGATFTDAARFDDATFGFASFDGAVFTTGARFDGATFAGGATFYGATFDGDASFLHAAFNPSVHFVGATFTTGTFSGVAFRRAFFSRAIFRGDAFFNGARFESAVFNSATFTGGATFYGAIFDDSPEFVQATFDGPTSFGGAVFTDGASFLAATFTGATSFDCAIFTDTALFGDAIFPGRVRFQGATFTGTAEFTGATFKDRVDFETACAHHWVFDSSTFTSPDPGPWMGHKVSLNDAVLSVRPRIEITAVEIDARSLKAPAGAHFVLRSEDVDLSDSEFLRPSIVAGPGTAQPYPDTVGDDESPHDSPPADARAVAETKANKLRDTLVHELNKNPPRCRLSKLERSTADELVLAGVVLDRCTFAGAHGLDKMRIGADCSFGRTRDRTSEDAFTRSRMVTGRRIIAEEIAWRKAHTGRTGTAQRNQRGEAPASTLLAADIAGIYRDLRKGMEDVKNEPEAADFYYGEMEMRRLAGRDRGAWQLRAWRLFRRVAGPERGALQLQVWRLFRRLAARGSGTHFRRGHQAQSVTERILLQGYWAVSGYGLRAWRAITMLLVLIMAAALLFSYQGLATRTSPERIESINPKNGAVTYVHANSPAPEFLSALNFSARESISLLHADSPSVKTQGVGTLIDFVLRLAGPVLLAFIVLALHARTKR